ncbi:MAG TPA: LysM domain-containing protein [Desulfatirhabdiaceae bacterium]|nr:LysM domain-containing protein [Desulfatirhabdiaceae bacterium]
MKTLFVRISRLIMTVILVGSWPVIRHTAAMDQSIDQETHMRYTVRSGDTLWHISQKFYNTPAAWPDIWSLNPHINNPHRLNPGDRLDIMRETRQEVMTEEAATVVPPAIIESQPARPDTFYRYPGIDRVGFIRDEPVSAEGTVVMLRNDPDVPKDMLSQGDMIYVKSASEMPLPAGNRYVTYRILNPVKFSQTDEPAGYPHYLTGLATILESKGDISLARIDKSFRPVKVNDLMMPYSPRSEQIPLIQAASQVEGHILDTEEQDSMFAAGAIVYIDKGREDGIQSGQRYALYEEDELNLSRLSYDYGEILVLSAEATTATALITRTDRTVRGFAGFRSPSSEMMLRTDLR